MFGSLTVPVQCRPPCSSHFSRHSFMAANHPHPRFKVILGSSSVARRKILAEMGYEFTIKTADIDEKSIRKDKPEELVLALAEAKANAIISKLQIEKSHEGDSQPTVLVAADTTSSQAEALAQKLPLGGCIKDDEPTLLITGDQVVVYEGAVREKPSSKEEAREFIKGYSAGQAATVSSVFVTNLKTGLRKGQWDRVEALGLIKLASFANAVNGRVKRLQKDCTFPWIAFLVKCILFHEIPDEVIDKLIDEGHVLYVAGALIIEHPLILPYVKKVVGTTDSVMGLPKALTEKLMKEVL